MISAFVIALIGAFFVGWVFPVLLSLVGLLVAAAIVCWGVRLILRARDA